MWMSGWMGWMGWMGNIFSNISVQFKNTFLGKNLRMLISFSCYEDYIKF